MEAIYALAVVLVLVVMYYMAQKTGDSSTEEHFNDGSNTTPQGLPLTPAVGEDNPILKYYDQLQGTGQWNTYASGANTLQGAYDSLLHENGVMTKTEENRHKNYYGSNVGRYPFVGRATNVDHKTTIMPYVGGTRAMRGVSIRPTESVVPDKVNLPVQPY